MTARAAVVLVLLLAAPAQATTVSGDANRLDVAGGAEANEITLAQAPGGLRVTDVNDISPGGACQAESARSVVCPADPLLVDVSLGDGDDRATISGGYFTLRVFAGAGGDTVDLSGVRERSSDGRLEVTAGDGDDTVTGSPDNDNVWPGLGTDVVDGGAGSDFAYYYDHPQAVTLDLRREDGQGSAGENDTLRSFVGGQGSVRDDVLIGDDGANYLSAPRGTIASAGSAAAITSRATARTARPTTSSPPAATTSAAGRGTTRSRSGRARSPSARAVATSSAATASACSRPTAARSRRGWWAARAATCCRATTPASPAAPAATRAGPATTTSGARTPTSSAPTASRSSRSTRPWS